MRLLISSFDAAIRVKRAFHPAPASRGFASHVFLVIPREARAEGPSVARLINLSGRRPRSGAKPCEFEPNIYLYICLYISVKVSVLLPGNNAQTKYE